MKTIDRCLSQINSVRNVATGIEPSYVARSRIGRLTISCASLVAESIGVAPPVLSGPIRVHDSSSPTIKDLARSCNQIYDLARHLSKPSEPLDERWTRGWQELLGELVVLEARIEELREEQNNA